MPHGKLPTKVLHRDALSCPTTLPEDTMCLQVIIPNDLQYLLSFEAVLSLLGKWNSYRQDGAHQAADVAQLWRDVFAEHPIEVCKPAEETGGIDEEDEVIRKNPDNDCQLQVFCAGQWETFFDVADCFQKLTSQPGPGGDGPGPGETEKHCLKLDGSGQVLLPIPVQAGQTITVTDASGGWTDGSGIWWCPDGQHFVAGFCADAQGHDGGDPNGPAYHGSLILSIDGTYYPIMLGAVTVPTGVTDGQVVFQMNDESLSDNAGQISFCVTVTTPQEGIDITYEFGSGPSRVQIGQLFTMTSENSGGGDQRLTPIFDPCVKVTYVASSGYVPNPDGTRRLYDYLDCASSVHNGPLETTTSLPTDYDHNLEVTKISMTGDIDHPYTVTARIDALA